jgi:hypothetical protein
MDERGSLRQMSTRFRHIWRNLDARTQIWRNLGALTQIWTSLEAWANFYVWPIISLPDLGSHELTILRTLSGPT